MLNKGNASESICRVCGYSDGSIRWEYFEGVLYSQFLICDCCGAESGYEDCLLTAIQNYRREWLESGTKWFCQKSKPENWNLEKQLAHIPDDYK
jgi:hypothetical protein